MKVPRDVKTQIVALFFVALVPLSVFGEELEIRPVTRGPKFHWFGYYDVLQFDPSQRYLLGMEVDFENRSPGPEDKIKIGMVDLEEGDRWIELGESRAWGWQQGCRLQWRPGSDCEVIWNDCVGGRFVCHILDVKTGKKRTWPHPVYHVSPKGRWALGTDFSRINDMRPGYGYAGIPDPSRDISAPGNSGIYKLDLDTGEYRFLFSLAHITEIPYPGTKEGDKHYFNHIEWNPDGTRFLFLHRWRPEGKRSFCTRMFTADADGKDIRLVTDEPHISHYTWRDREHILIHREGYRLYRDDGSGDGEFLLKASNGHQTFLPGGEWLVTDTYPSGKDREMELYLFHIPTRQKVVLGRFYLPPEYKGEWRVDLHPRLSPDGTKIVIDSAHRGEGRQMYLIDIEKILAAMEKPNIWIEAEDAFEAPGLERDPRKAGAASNNQVLGVHSDRVSDAMCEWEFELEAKVENAELRIRFAAEGGGAFDVLLDGEEIGRVTLPITVGWGYRDEEWRWGAVGTGMTLEGGRHVLALRAALPKPVNLDCLAMYEKPATDMVDLPLEPADRVMVGRDVELVEWNPSNLVDRGSFLLGEEEEGYHAWGVGGRQHRAFFQEFLPALFERTLTLDSDACRFEWIFTGERGGFTLFAEPGAVYLQQRFYDSFAFNEIQGRAARHPEWKAVREGVSYEGELKAITVRKGYDLMLSVALNGRTVMKRKCLFDVSRHQLRRTGGEGTLRGRMLGPEPEERIVRIHPKRRHQTMIGFGGIATPTAYAQLSEEGKKRWWEILCEYNLLIQREYPNGLRLNPAMDNWDLLTDATPHYYGDNFPNGEISDFEYLRKLRELGGKVWFEFWALPPWVGRDARKYAEAMVGYCKASKERAGAPPDVVGIQNEVTQPESFFHEMTMCLRRELDRAGFEDVEIHMSDSSSLAGGIKRAGIFSSSGEVWRTIDYSATHMYDFQNYFTRPDEYDALLEEWRDLVRGKPFLSTELCINRTEYQLDTYAAALTMGQLYHKNLVIADAAAICFCWTILNVVQPSYGATRSLFVPDRSTGFMPAPSSRQLRVFGAFSRRVHEGMVRVDAEAEGKDLLVSAFVGEGGMATLVALNRSSKPIRMSLDWPGAAFDTMEIVEPYHENLVIEITDGGGKTVHEVQPGAIVTLTNVPLLRSRF